MATIVTGDRYMELDGKITEIKRQLRQNGGYPFDLGRLDGALQATVEGRFEAVGGVFPSQLLAPDLIPAGWRIESDVEPTEFEVSDLEFIPFLKEGETVVTGDVMCERALVLKANLGLADGKKILANQDKIPKKLRGKWIALTGTVLRDLGGKRLVAHPYWRGDRWGLRFYWLSYDWNSLYRLARRK